MALEQLPEAMIVVGGGYVAMEQAQLFSLLGTEVTMLVRSRMARGEEPELAKGIRDAFIAQGIDVLEGVQPAAVRRDGDITVVAGDRSSARRSCCWRPAGSRAPPSAACRPSACSSALVVRSSSTSTCARPTRGCGRPATSPATRSSSTSPPSTAAS
jgi:hypothetical protein